MTDLTREEAVLADCEESQMPFFGVYLLGKDGGVGVGCFLCDSKRLIMFAFYFHFLPLL